MITRPMSMTEKNIDRLLAMMEESLREKALLVENKRGPMEEAKLLYEMALGEYQAAKQELENEQEIQESLIRFKLNPEPDKEIRVMRTTSVVDAPHYKKREIKWLDITVTILRDTNSFLTYDDLFSRVCNFNKETADAIKRQGRAMNVLKNTVVHNWERAGTVKNKKIVVYKNHIGLPEWFNGDAPLPSHIKPFMHGSHHRHISN